MSNHIKNKKKEALNSLPFKAQLATMDFTRYHATKGLQCTIVGGVKPPFSFFFLGEEACFVYGLDTFT